MAGPVYTTAVGATNEKSLDVKETSTGTSSPVTQDEPSIVSDGDDALNLAGTHAHTFDEKYYARLRRKIVCILRRLSLTFPSS